MNREDYPRIKELLISHIRDIDPQCYLVTDAPRSYQERTNIIKNEYEEAVRIIQEENKEIRDAWDLYCVTVAKYNPELYGVDAPWMKLIPEEYYQTKEVWYPGVLSISCHEGTMFYRFMLENGVLKKLVQAMY